MNFLLTIFAVVISTCAFSQDTLNTYPGDDIVKQQIVGKWKDQNSIITFEANGKYKTVWSKKLSDNGTWEVKNRMLVFKTRKHKLVHITSLKFNPDMYNIIYFTANRMSYRLKKFRKDPTVWLAEKFEE